MVDDLPDTLEKQDIVCGTCLVGKEHKKPFDEGKDCIFKVLLELIHADICGPMKTISFSGARYFLLFVDDFSRKMWVYFLSKKSYAFSKFQEFKAMVEKKLERSIILF
jgi:hypothetical protein